MKTIRILLSLGILAGAVSAQIPTPQINLTGNIGCQGFPCVNSGTLVMAADANRNMTATETSAFNMKVTSSVTLTATRNLVAPAGRFHFVIENATTGGQSIQIIGATGTGVTIANGTTVAVWNDGTNFVQVGAPGGGGGLSGQTPTYLPKANASTTSTGPSIISDDGATATVHGGVAVADGTGNAGLVALKQGTAGATTANSVGIEAPASVTAYNVKMPSAQWTGLLLNDGAGNLSGASILPVVNGGTGTATPSIVAGTNVTVTGTWPNQTVNSTGGGGGTLPTGSGIPTIDGGATWGPTIPEVPVENYGAVGYATRAAAIAGTDSTTAIQSCLNGALPRKCLLQPLFYKTTAVLTITHSSVGIKGFLPDEKIADTTSVPIPSAIVSTSASADIIDVTGTSLADAISLNTFENFGVERSVTPTGTAAGIYLNFTTAATVTRVTSHDSIYGFRVHGSGGNGIGAFRDTEATFGYYGVTSPVAAHYGYFIDSVDGTSNFSMVFYNNATSCFPGSTGGYGFVIKGAHANDIFATLQATSTCDYGNYLQYTGGGADDTEADIHIWNSINDSNNISGTYVTGFNLPAGAPSVEIAGGWNASSVSGSHGIDIVNSNNVIVAHTMDSDPGGDLVASGSSNLVINSNQFFFNNAAVAALSFTSTNYSSITGNAFSLNNAGATGISFDAFSFFNAGLETNSFSGTYSKKVATTFSNNPTYFYDEAAFQLQNSASVNQNVFIDESGTLKGLLGLSGTTNNTSEPKDHGKFFLQAANGSDICAYALIPDPTCAIFVSHVDDAVGIGGAPVPTAGAGAGRSMTIVASDYAQQYFKANNAAANEKIWRWISRTSNDIELQAMTDDNATEQDAFYFTRSGGTPNLMEVFPNFKLNKVLQFAPTYHGAVDAGISRDAAGVLDVGNGTAGNASGTLKAAVGTFSGAVTGTTLTPLYDVSGTLQASSHMVQGSGTLVANTLTITLSGSAVFTSSSSFSCTAHSTDNSTAAFGFTYASGSSFSAFADSATTPFRYTCIGN